jgi:hypothetical protein
MTVNEWLWTKMNVLEFWPLMTIFMTVIEYYDCKWMYLNFDK